MKRISGINNIIKREVSKSIFNNLDIGRDIFTTVTRVETSSNIIQAKIYISVIPEKEFDRVLRILNRNIYKIQQELNKKLRMRPVPKILFVKENKTKEADRIDGLLTSLKKNQ